jgi:hypothetical protein
MAAALRAPDPIGVQDMKALIDRCSAPGGSVRAPFGRFVQKIDHEQLLKEAKDEAMRTVECSLSGGHNTSLRRDSPSGR